MGNEGQSFTRCRNEGRQTSPGQRISGWQDFPRAPHAAFTDQRQPEVAAPHQIRGADGTDPPNDRRQSGVETCGEMLRHFRARASRASQKGVDPDAYSSAARSLWQIVTGRMRPSPHRR